MVDSPSYPDGSDAGAGPDRGSSTGTPRWVKAFAIIGLVLVLFFAFLFLTGRGGGSHGPGLHTSSSDAGAQRSTATGIGSLPGALVGRTPPEGGLG